MPEPIFAFKTPLIEVVAHDESEAARASILLLLHFAGFIGGIYALINFLAGHLIGKVEMIEHGMLYGPLCLGVISISIAMAKLHRWASSHRRDDA